MLKDAYSKFRFFALQLIKAYVSTLSIRYK